MGPGQFVSESRGMVFNPLASQIGRIVSSLGAVSFLWSPTSRHTCIGVTSLI